MAELIFTGGSIFGIYCLVKFVGAKPKSALKPLWPSKRVIFWVLNFVISAIPTQVAVEFLPVSLGMLLFPIFAGFMLFGFLLFKSRLGAILKEWLLSFTRMVPGLVFYVLHHQLKVATQPNLSFNPDPTVGC